MAVYTLLNKEQISAILMEYPLGSLSRFEPIASGIENTNYFVWVDQGDSEERVLVLTIFENLSEDSLPFYNDLTRFLAQQGFLVPAPFCNQRGVDVFKVNDATASAKMKFGVLVPKFSGVSLVKPDALACQKIAQYVAKMHLALADYEAEQEAEHTLDWCRRWVGELASCVTFEESSLLSLALERYQGYAALIESCPKTVVHGDLFRDNVLFDGGEITGIIDFYHAGQTASLFDLAVIANDWAVNFDQLPATFAASTDQTTISQQTPSVYDEEKLRLLVSTYHAIKPLSDAEKSAWPKLLELAAFRFWLSRLKTKYLAGYQTEVKQGDVVKSPEAMQLILASAMRRDPLS
ncbi:MAG: homoserine kinase [Oleiphilus sp.]